MILARKKLSKYPNFYDICPKNQLNSRILHDFTRKMPEFYVIIARKIFSRFFFWGGGHVPPYPQYPTSMPTFRRLAVNRVAYNYVYELATVLVNCPVSNDRDEVHEDCTCIACSNNDLYLILCAVFARDAVAKRGTCYGNFNLSVCLSVCLSHSTTVSRWLQPTQAYAAYNLHTSSESAREWLRRANYITYHPRLISKAFTATRTIAMFVQRFSRIHKQRTRGVCPVNFCGSGSRHNYGAIKHRTLLHFNDITARM